MQGIIGLVLVIIGGVLLYDVVAGKAQGIVGLLNGQVETEQNGGKQLSSDGSTGTSNGSGLIGV